MKYILFSFLIISFLFCNNDKDRKVFTLVSNEINGIDSSAVVKIHHKEPLIDSLLVNKDKWEGEIIKVKVNSIGYLVNDSSKVLPPLYTIVISDINRNYFDDSKEKTEILTQLITSELIKKYPEVKNNFINFLLLYKNSDFFFVYSYFLSDELGFVDNYQSSLFKNQIRHSLRNIKAEEMVYFKRVLPEFKKVYQELDIEGTFWENYYEYCKTCDGVTIDKYSFLFHFLYAAKDYDWDGLKFREEDLNYFLTSCGFSSENVDFEYIDSLYKDLYDAKPVLKEK